MICKFIFLILKIFSIFTNEIVWIIRINFHIIIFFGAYNKFLFFSQIMDITFLLLFISGLNFILLGVICEIIKINLK